MVTKVANISTKKETNHLRPYTNSLVAFQSDTSGSKQGKNEFLGQLDRLRVVTRKWRISAI